jgi:DNA-binding MarR family transcriptional regulator
MPGSAGSESRVRESVAGLLRSFAEESARLTAIFGDAHGLYTRDLAALSAIAQGAQTGRPLGPARLAEVLHLSPSATTTLIDRLEGVGHLVRQPDPSDRRRTVLDMQPQALEVASAFFEPMSVALGEVMDRYTPEQLTVIASFLTEAVQATAETSRAVAAEDRPTTRNQGNPA